MKYVKRIEDSCKKVKLNSYIIEKFPGECTMKIAQAIAVKCKKQGVDCIVSVGGGKGCDTAKVVADLNSIRVIVFSTAASCDAPCSHSAVLHHDDGQFEKVYYPFKSPDVVMVDTNIIAQAPVRLLVAGLGDALSTFFEARASHRTEHRNVSE
jgi:glycerol dehydrogenase